MVSGERIQVIAQEPGFFNGAYRAAGEIFYVSSGQEYGAHWFRPVTASSIPQGPPPAPAAAPKAPAVTAVKPAVYRRKKPAAASDLD